MIQWITAQIGTVAFGTDVFPEDCESVDVRSLVDRTGNTKDIISNYISTAILALRGGKRVVISCDHGISRSNSLAVAILSQWENIPISSAVQKVLQATGNAEIRLEVLDDVRKIMGEKSYNKQEERWLVVGGHGYLGSLLAKGCPSTVNLYRPSHAELDLMGAVEVDLYAREHEISRIVYFAAPRVGNVNSAMGQSVVMLKNIMDVAVNNELPLFIPSRWEVFSGYKCQEFHAEESMTPRPNGVLGYTKYMMEVLAQQYVDNLGLKLTLVRCGLVYGQGGSPNFIKYFINKAADDSKITTHQYLNGLPMLDLINSDDWNEGCWKILMSGLTGIFHLGSGSLVSTCEIARIIKETLNSSCELDRVKINDYSSNIILGAKRIGDEFGWRPRVQHNEMIEDFVKKSISFQN